MIKFNKRVTFISLLCFGAIGLGLLFTSFASTGSFSFEAENGQTSNGASIITGDTNTSGNAYVKFGNTTKGQYIVYNSNSGTDSYQVWRMKSDGSNPTRLTNDPDNDIVWTRPSPDGTKILFYKQQKGTGGINNVFAEKKLWIMNSDGTNQHQILEQSQYGWRLITHGEWSPDSTKFVQAVVVSSGITQLFIFNADGTNPQQITNNATVDGYTSSDAHDPSWPNNNTLVFIRYWNCASPCSNNDLFKIDIPTKKETRLTNDNKTYWDPYLSPDGKTYIWLQIEGFGGESNLYRADANTQGILVPKLLVGGDGSTNPNGTFSPDSQFFIFPKGESWGFEVWRSVYRIKIDGTGLTRISKSADHSTEDSPAYQ